MEALTFSDVLIIPQYSTILSRFDEQVNISSNMGKFKLDLPIISANMKTITDPKMAVEMSKYGGLGILHRFNTEKQNIESLEEYWNITRNINNLKNRHIGVSIGVQEEDKQRFESLLNHGASIFCIDVAHGHHIKVKEMLKWIQPYRMTNDISIIAGNIATEKAALDLVVWGADILKVGIGPGHCCTTRKATGVGMPQLHALHNVDLILREEGLRNNIKIISDGGIEMVGDICKALKYADAVMVGNFISGTSETPGNVFRDENNNFYKVYAGSASGENKTESGGSTFFIEGISKKVPFRGHVKHILREIEHGIRSSFSYVGAFTLEDFRANCEFVKISNGAKYESKF